MKGKGIFMGIGLLSLGLGCTLEDVPEISQTCPPQGYTTNSNKQSELWIVIDRRQQRMDEVADLTEQDREWLRKGYCVGKYPTCGQLNGVWYCHKGCSDSSKILCGKGDCIESETSNEYCGAKGYCSSGVRENKDYAGEKCEGGKTCQGGICKCPGGQIAGGDGTCMNPNVENCGGVNCLEQLKNYEVRHLECVEGQCQIKSGVPENELCNSNAHWDGETCVENDLLNCGAPGASCCKNNLNNPCDPIYDDPQAKVVKCVDGYCVSTECKDGEVTQGSNGFWGREKYFNSYEPWKVNSQLQSAYDPITEGDIRYFKCQKATMSYCGKGENNNCGGIACQKKGKVAMDCCEKTGAEGSEGCEMSYQCGCGAGEYYDPASGCKANSENSCGKLGKKCSCADFPENAHCEEARCVIASGTCEVKKCEDGYKPCGQDCIESSVTCGIGVYAMDDHSRICVKIWDGGGGGANPK